MLGLSSWGLLIAAVVAIGPFGPGVMTSFPVQGAWPASEDGQLEFSPSQLDLGTVTVGGKGYAELSLVNGSSDALTGVSLSIEGAAASVVSIAFLGRPCSDGQLPAAGSCWVELAFAPTAVGSLGPVMLRATGLAADGTAPEASAVLTGWGTSWVTRDIPVDTTSGGADLALTVADDGKAYLHAVVSNLEEALPGGWDASAYVRTGNDGRTWGQRRLLEGMAPQVAAAGRHVYVAFQAYRCGGFGLIRSADHGRHGSWSPLTCLSVEHRIVIMPMAIAASGRYVYVVTRQQATKRVYVHISRDHGRTWTTLGLGYAHGWQPVEVAATGRRVAVGWANRGVTKARVSTDAGHHWSDKVRLPDGWLASAAGRNGRLAFGGVNNETPWIRLWAREQGWVSPLTAPGPMVALRGQDGLGVVGDDSDPYRPGACDLAWRTSTDGGGTWRPLERPAACGVASKIVWGGAGRVYFLTSAVEDMGYALAVRP